jgi:hypothetical protein
MMSFALGEMGMRDADFWELTPYELHRRVVGWNKKERAKRLSSLHTAWHTAAFIRARRMPSLMRILKPPKSRKLRGEELERRRASFEDRCRRAGVAIYGEKRDVV